jgi:TRAP-type C4-dicarboxylate transport system substrate-binding protein
MRKLLLIPLVVLLVTGLLAGGCSSSTAPPPSDSTSKPAVSSTPQIYNLKIAHNAPACVPGDISYECTYEDWAAGIEKDTNGRVKFTIYPAGTLLDSGEKWDGVLANIAEISHVNFSAVQELPLHNLLELPGFAWTSSEQRIRIMKEVRANIPEMQAEWDGLEILYYMDIPPRKLLISKSDLIVRTPQDLNGLRMAADPGPALEMLEAMGGTPVSVAFPDMYMSLERGVVDGTFAIMGGARAAKWYEVAYSWTTIPAGHSTIVVFMNKDVWDSLPPDIQQVFRDWEEFAQAGSTLGLYQGAILCEEGIAKLNQTMYEPNPEELQLWLDAMMPYLENTIQKLEAEGLPAQAVYDETQRLIEKYK